jgi:oligopeptide/dipeptide ABC transporter ATP-binding protein
MQMSDNRILEIQDLEVKFFQDLGTVHAVNGVSLSVDEGQSIGIVGESGCGKTITSHSVLQLLPRSGRITDGRILYRGRARQAVDLAQLDPDGEEIRAIRGRDIAMIFQEPMSSLSPVHTIYDQIAEMLFLHQEIDSKHAREQVVDMLGRVGINAPDQRADEYIFQLSGGMRQRVMIAMALVCNPRILIADEPTTALDVTIQAQVLKLIKSMQEATGLSLILITHDLGVVAHVVDYVYVMYLGQIMESGPVNKVLVDPAHPYTRDLLRSIPRIREKGRRIEPIQGTVPDAYKIPPGCPFADRCTEVVGPQCRERRPGVARLSEDHSVACYRYPQAKTPQKSIGRESPGGTVS